MGKWYLTLKRSYCCGFESHLDNMKYKILKHKNLKGTFGYLHMNEIYHSSTPTLFHEKITINLIGEVIKNPLIAIQLADYDLITIKLTECKN